MLVEKGAVPESIFVDSKFFPDKSLLRITAVGNVEMEGSSDARNVFSEDEALGRASEIIGADSESVSLRSRWDHCFVFAASLEQRKLFGKRKRLHVVAIDRYGRLKFSVERGRSFTTALAARSSMGCGPFWNRGGTASPHGSTW